MHLPKSHIGISQHQQDLSHRSLSSTVLWSLRCLLVGLLCFCFQRSTLLLADNSLVTQEIRYHMPEAGEVFLIWGINGWAIVVEENRPVGTAVKDGVMHTPMAHEGDTFIAKVQVPAGTIIDYGFLVTKTRRGAATEIWDGNGDREQGYHTIAEQENVTEVQAPPSIAQKIAEADPAVVPSWLGLVLATGVCVVLGTVMARAWILRRSGGAQAGIVGIERSLEAPSRGRRLIYLYDLLRELVVRDMKLRYKRSVLGIVWSLLNPLFQMLVFIFLSRRVLSLEIPNYPSFVFTGTLAWNWFQTTVVMATSAITGNRELIKRPGFPVGILPVVMVTTNMIHFMLALPVPLLFLVLGGGRLTGVILTLPLVIVPQFLLILGLGYLAATFQVTFRDTQHILVVLFSLLYFLTPVFYDANMVPVRYQTLYRLNPMFHLITAYRAILIQGTLPDLATLLALGVLGGVLLRLGHAIFTRASIRFVEEL
jgi:lipopolysaccharide transport system permease protein